jgi:hypothetical protein
MPPSFPTLAAAALLLGAALAGCGTAAAPPGTLPDTADTTPAATPPTTVPNAAEEQPLTRLVSTTQSGFREATELVVRDDAALAAAWRTLHQGLPAEPPPAVDFARAMVIVVASGERNTGGHAVRVDGVAPERDGAVVRYTVTRPGPGCMTSMEITAPAEVVQAPRAAGAVRFERREAVQDC